MEFNIEAVLTQSWSCLLASGIAAPIRQLRLQDSPRRSGREQGRGGNSSFAGVGELYLALGISARTKLRTRGCPGHGRPALGAASPRVATGTGSALAEDQRDVAGHGEGWRPPRWHRGALTLFGVPEDGSLPVASSGRCGKPLA